MNFQDKASGPIGIFKLLVWQHDKLVDEYVDTHLIEEFGPVLNQIVDGSKTAHAHLIGGDVTNRSVTKFGVGTNGTTPVAGDSALTGSYIKLLDAVSYPTSSSVLFNFSLATGEANGMAILEFGLLTAGSALYARKTRSVALNKASDISFSGTWQILF